MADTLQDGNALPALIIKKTIKLPEEPHGGAWKVAYADFVTAMMAFFLLLWLLNVTTEDKKQGISNFFEPVGVSEDQTGSGGVLKGLALSVQGALRSAGSPPRITVLIPTFGSEDTGSSEGRHELPHAQGGGYSVGAAQSQVDRNAEEAKMIASALRQAVQDIPDLDKVQENLIVEQTPNGLRIQLIDRLKLKMFKEDGTALSDRGRHLLAIISSIIGKLPHNVVLTGHIDAPGKTSRHARGKWETSGDRAESTRQALIEFGIAPDRFTGILGKADTEPLHPNVRRSPRNNRVSILLHRKPDGEGGKAPAHRGSVPKGG